MRKIFWIILGLVGLGLGCIGAVLPMVPTVPFLLLAAMSFAKGSYKLHVWFIHTNLYKNNLETYVKGQGMSIKTKRKVMTMVSILMSFGFFMMLKKEIYIPCVILLGVWLFHIVYFTFIVKTYND